MKKLNKRKIRWIVKEVKRRRMGIYSIAKIQGITQQHTRLVYRKYNGVKEPRLLPCGRKPKTITEQERQLIRQTWKEYPVGACNMQTILGEKGIHLSHNRIHRIMREEGLAKPELKKQKRRRWIRYERKHSLSLVHSDWFEFKGRSIILFEDDASRFITGYGEHDNATTDTALKTFMKSLRFGKPKQVHTDHGTQFVSNERENCKTKDSSFTQALKELGIQHIKARVKHPQTNGKIERLIATIKQLYEHFDSLDKAVKYYNFKRPHMSLENGKLRTPYQSFLEKTRKAYNLK